MPHSSGGGSHSGGSHGGSSGSHHSHGSSGFSRPTPRVRDRYFPGSHRYVRRHDDGAVDYIYSDSASLNKHSRPWALLLVYIPFLLIGAFVLGLPFHIPHKMDVSYNPPVVVSDLDDRISRADEQLVMEGAQEVYDATGVPICVRFEDNSDWEGNYDSLEDYAYDVYVNMYDDEDHWLIIYTDDLDRRSANKYSNWYFEGMQGDNTDKALPANMTETFNDNLYMALLDRKNTTGQAFKIGFHDLAKDVGHISFNKENGWFSLFWNGFILLHMALAFLVNPNKEYREYELCPMNMNPVYSESEHNLDDEGTFEYSSDISDDEEDIKVDYETASDYDNEDSNYVIINGKKVKLK